MKYSNTAITQLTRLYKSILVKCAIFNAAILMSSAFVAAPAMASDPITDTPVFVFGDVSFADQDVAKGEAAFGGRRMNNWVEGKYQNDFPQYQMVGSSFALTGSKAYVGPVNLTLRELTSGDAFKFNYQKDVADQWTDVDLAALAGVNWNDNYDTVYSKVAKVIGENNAKYTAPAVYAMAQKSDTTAGVISFNNTNAVIDGATVNADSISVTNGSTLTFAKQDTSLLNTSATFFTNAADIDSDGKSALNAKTINMEGSRIVVNSGAELTVNASDGATFSNANSTTNGGAIYNEGEITLNNSIFTGNSSTGNSGAIAQHDVNSVLTLNNTQFNSNSADWGGAIVARGTVNITGGSFKENHSNDGGGAIYLATLANKGHKLSIDGTTFTGNYTTAAADGSDGGGAIGSFSDLTVRNATFTNNSVTGSNSNGGGAIMMGSVSTNDIQSSTFTGNTSDTNGGAIATRFAVNSNNSKNDNSGAKLDITGTSFESNSAEKGGAIYNTFYNGDKNSGYVTVSNSSFTSNSAEKGGAVYNDGTKDTTDKSGAIKVLDTNFTNNTASALGGAIYNESELIVAANTADVMFSGNTANGAANDIYNAGTLTLNAASGKTISLEGGIDGDSANKGTVNVAGDVEVSTIKNQTVAHNSGELHITNGAADGSNLNGSTVTVASDAIINTIDDVVNDYSSNINLADGAKVKGDVDFENGVADKYAATSGTIKYMVANLIGAAANGSKTIQVAGNGSTINVSEAKFNAENGLTFASSGAADGTMIVNGMSGGIEEAADVSSNVETVDYDFKADESVDNNKEFHHIVTVNGDGTSVLTLNADLGTAAGANTTYNKMKFAGTGALNNNGTLHINDSDVAVNVNNYGRLISDPTTYTGKVTNAAGAYASFEGDTFTGTAELANSGDVYLEKDALENSVTFDAGAKITGNGDLYLMSGTTAFNNTANTNDAYLASGAKFSGALVGGSLDTQNGAIDTGLGTIQNADLYMDAKLSGTGSADAFVATTGSTIKEITILGNDYNPTKDELKIAVGTATLDDDVVINGANYYTSITKDTEGNLVFSDKLINTSTLRGTGDGSSTFVGDVVIGDKAATTTLGTNNVNIALNNAAKTIDIASGTATNGAIVGVESGTTNAVDISAVDSTANKSAEIDVNATTGKIKLEANDTGATKTAKVEVDGTTGRVTATAAGGFIVSDGTNNATLTAKTTGLDVAQGLTVGGTSYGINSTGAASVASLSLAGTAVTSTAAEINQLHESGAVKADFEKLHAVTADAAELNVLDGITASTAELNLLDGMTAVNVDSGASVATDKTTLATVSTVKKAIADTDEMSESYNDGSNVYTSSVAVESTATDKKVTLGVDKDGTTLAGITVDGGAATPAVTVTGGLNAANGLTVGSGTYGINASGAGTLASLTVGGYEALTTNSALNGARLTDGTVAKTALADAVQNNLLDNATSSDGLTITDGDGTTPANIALKLASTGGLEEDTTNGLQIKAGGVQLSMINGAAMTSAAVDTGSTGTKLVNETSLGATRGAIETKLTAGASGYDIDAKTLKVLGKAVLSTENVAPNYTYVPSTSTIADVTTYVSTNGAKLANVASTAGLIETVMSDKEDWIGRELGYDPKTTDANTVLSGEGFTDKDSSGKVSFNDAVVQLKDDITVTAAGNYIAAGENVAGNLGNLDTALHDVATIVGPAQTTAATTGQFVGRKIGADINLVNAVDELGRNMVSLGANNVFTGENTFRNTNGVTIQNTGGTLSATLKATDDGLEVSKAVKAKGFMIGSNSVTSIDISGAAVNNTTAAQNVMATGATVYEGAENAKYDGTKINGDTSSTTIKAALDTTNTKLNAILAPDGSKVLADKVNVAWNSGTVTLDNVLGNGVYSSTNYVAAGDSVTTAVSKLDGQVKTNAGDIADINTAITVTADGTYIKAANDVKANLSALDTQVKQNAGDISDIKTEIGTYGTIVTKDAAPAFTGSTLADVNAYVTAQGAKVADVATTAGVITAVLADKEAWIGDQLGFNPKTTDANTVLGGEGFTDQDGDGKVSFNDAVVQLKADGVIGTASVSSAGYAATATVKDAVVAIDAALKVDEGNIATNTANIGTLTSLTTDAKGNLVAAINEVDAHADAVQTEVDNIETALGVVNADGTYKASALNNNMFESGGTAASSLDGALLNLATNTTTMTGASIDDSGNLKVNYTSNNYVVDDTNLVASVSALDGALGAKVTGTNGNVLNTNSVNANLDKIDVNMGNLASLATTSSSGKASLVGAVNEVVSDITVAAGTYNVIHAGANVAQNLIDLDAVVGGADAKITSIGDSIGGTWSGNTFTHSNYNSAQNNILNTDNLTTAIGKLDTVIGDADSIVVTGYTGTEVVGAINKLNTNMTDGSLDAKFKSVTIDKAYAITGTTTGELDMGGNALKNVKGLELKDSTGTKSVALTVDGTTNDLVVNQGLKAASLESLGDLTVGGNATITGNLQGSTATFSGAVNVGSLEIGGTGYGITSTGAAKMGTVEAVNGLTVGSANALTSSVAGQLDMGANNLVNIASITTTGNATVGGDLGVTGTSNLHDTNVQGNLTLKNAADPTKTVAMDVRRITVGSDNNDVVQVNGGLLSTNVIASTNGFKVLNSTSADKYTEVFDIDDHGSITSDVFSTNNTAAGNTVTIGKADNSTATTVKGTLEVTGATTLDSTLTANGESKFGKDTSGVYSLDVTDSAVTANKVVEAKSGVKFGTDTTAMTGVSRANLSSVVDHTTNDSVIASAAAVQETRKDIEDKAHAVLGDVYKIDSTTRAVSYDNTALEETTPNGFETGATDLTDALTKYADNVMAAMGTTYAANGTYTNGFAKPAAVDYDGLATNQSLVAAISQLDKNIGTAITGTDRSGTAFDTSATNTVNENIAALDAAIGADVTKEYNGVVKTNSINQNIDAISTTLGRMDNLSTAARTAGNAVVVRGNLTNANNTPLTADLTVADALSNIDQTLGRIHGLYDGTTVNVTNTSYPSVTGANSNLAKNGQTVENHLVSLDNAIGSRNIASLNTDINKAVNGDATAAAGTEARNGSLALGLQSVGDQMGDMNFTSTHYVAAGDNLSGAVRTLDSNLYRVEEDLRDLRRDFNNGMASMSAMSALVPNPRAAGNTSLSVGTGAYNGRTAVAVGGFHHINDNIMLNAGAAWGNASDVAYRLGITWSW